MKQKQTNSKRLLIGIILIVALILITAGSVLAVYLAQQRPAEPDGPFCTMEAKICSDGSYVGRGGPNCAFEPCPGEPDATKNE